MTSEELTLTDINSPSPPERMRRIPQQIRSKRMVKAILDSALLILKEYSRDGLTTTTLAHVSGIPKSTLYEYFPNIDAIVSEVFHEVIRHHHESGYRRYPLPGKCTVKDFIESIVDWVIEKHAALLELDKDFYIRFASFYDFWMEFDKSFSNSDSVSNFLTRQLGYCHDFISSPYDDLLGKTIGRSLSLTTFAMLQENPELIRDEQFRNTLIRMCLGICMK